MSLYSLVDVAEKLNYGEIEDPGYVFVAAVRPDALPLSAQLQMGIVGPPLPPWRYFEGDDGRLFCWNTQPLSESYYRPYKWMFWVLVKINDDEYERETDSIRFTDLRREAKEEALARWKAANEEAS